MAKRVPRWYWDTSIFLMVLKGEECHGPHVLEAAREQMREAEAGRLVIVTSSITLTEILPRPPHLEEYDRFLGWLQREHAQVHDVTQPIASRAARIRRAGLDCSPKLKIKAPDAIHIATALIHTVGRFHSVDSSLNLVFQHLDLPLRGEPPQLEQLTMPLSAPGGPAGQAELPPPDLEM